MDENEAQLATVAAIERGLRQVLARGLLPARLLECDAFPPLKALDTRLKGSGAYDRAFALEGLLRDALDALGDGPFGDAARLLFGAVSGTRGLPLKERRRQAADRLGLLPSTFRQNYEDPLMEDFAAEVVRAELAAMTNDTRDQP